MDTHTTPHNRSCLSLSCLALLVMSAPACGIDDSSEFDERAADTADVAPDSGPEVESADAAPAAIGHNDADQANAALESVARALASSVTDDDLCAMLKDAIDERETGDYEALFRSVRGRELASGLTLNDHLLAAVSPADEGRGRMRLHSALASLPGMHIAMPQGTEGWNVSEAALVAFAPVSIDGEEPSEILAFDADGDEHWLDAHTPPEQPVLVVALNERLDDSGNVRPKWLWSSPTEVTDDAPPLQDANEYTLGIPRIMILNDHEPWYLGNPEIYVKMRRWLLPSGVFVDTRTDLGNVNDEDKWYWLGDPNDTYEVVGTNFDQSVEITIYEEDTGSDDFVGLFIPKWPSIPLGGYHHGTALGTTRDARIQLDRD